MLPRERRRSLIESQLRRNSYSTRRRMSRERYGSESKVITTKQRDHLEKQLENLHIKNDKPPTKNRELMNLHEKAFSSEAVSNGTSLVESPRPRCYTADETFHAAKNWLLRKKQRRSSYQRGTDVPPLAYDNGIGSKLTDRSGSLSALWSTSGGRPETVSLLIIGQSKSGKSALIEKIMGEWASTHDNVSPVELGRSFSFDDESERIWVKSKDPDDGLCTWTKIRFVEVDDEINDLWRSLSGSGFIIIYTAQSSASLKNAADNLTWLRTPAHDPHQPVWLVGTEPPESLKQQDLDFVKRGHAEAKLLAQTFKCFWLQIPCAAHPNGITKNGLSSAAYWTPGRLLASILDSVIYKKEIVFSERRGSDKVIEESRKEKLFVKQQILRKSSSHSCEDLPKLISCYKKD